MFAQFGVEMEGIHATDDPVAAVLRALQGMPYAGWSAGSNLACPTIMTTNDMPICDPGGFDALGLVPFQINPHYLHGHPPGLKGETREDASASSVRCIRACGSRACASARDCA